MFYPGLKSYQALTAIYLVLLLALFGCGSDSDQDAAPTVTSTATTLAALNGIEVVQPGVLADIDLVNLVKANGKVVIKNVYTEQVRCPTPEVSVRGFNVYPQSGVACDYHYTVEAGLLQASARVTVLATRAENPIIPPLSHPMSLDSAGVAFDFDFDLVQLLGADFPNGYNLTSVEMMPAQNGDAGQQGSVIFSGNTVTYTPPARIGFDGITYTLQKDGNPEFTVIGSIYITISNSPNEAPVIAFPNFSYQPTPRFIARAEYSIDLAQAGMTISVANGKEYHLQHVQSPTATVSPYDNAANNKRIRFQAATPGEHLVSYIVADDFGGFTMGFIKVQVDAVLNPVTWSDLEIEGRTFTAPVLYTPQLTNMFNAIPVWDDSVNNNTIPVTTVTGWTPPPSGAATVFGNTLAAFRSYSAAQAYCGTRGGRLPSYDESHVLEGLQVGVDEFGLINTAPGWPKGRPYALMVNGAEPAGFPWERGAYVTCVKHTAMELDLVATEFERFARDSGALLSQELGTLTTEFPMQQISHKIIGGSLMNYPESIVIDRLSDGNRLHRITAQASRNGYATIRFFDTTNPNNYIDTPMLRFLSIDVLDTGGGKLLTGSPSKLNVAILQRESTNTIVNDNAVRPDINTGFTYGAFTLSSGEKVCQLYNDVTLYGRSNWVMSTYSELRSIAAYGDMKALGWPTVQYYKSGDSCGFNKQQHYYIDKRINDIGCVAAEQFHSFISCSSGLPVDNDKSTIAVIINNALANNTAINQVRVTVRDASNALVAGQEVSFSASNGATVETPTVPTNGNGVAIASIKSAQSGISTITASFNGTIKTVDVTFTDVNCQSLAGACIDIFDTGNGKLFTSSPSVAYLGSIGGSATNGTYTENGVLGPAGSFYVFNWNSANVLCTTYRTNSLAGRTNWRLATKDELQVELNNKHGAMFIARFWPTGYRYWSVTPDGSNYYSVGLNNSAVVYSDSPSGVHYASCVSAP